MIQSADYDFLLTSRKQLKAFNCFWAGFVIYTVASTLYKLGFITQFKYAEAFQGLGLFLFLISSIFLINFRIENKYAKYIFIIYIIWLLTVVARGFSLNYQFINILMFDDYFGIFPFLSPLLLLFPHKIVLFKRLFQFIVILGIINLLVDVLFARDLLNRDISDADSRSVAENLTSRLAIPCTFLLLTLFYQIKKVKLFAWFVIFLTVCIAIIRARRGMLFTLVTPMLFAGYLYFLDSKKKIGMILIGLVTAAFIGVSGLQFFSNSSFFDSFKSRINDDTRTGVEECYYNDMKPMDWIIGKGMNGQYYCPHIDPNALTDYRSIIETDYLNIILKGGTLSLGLFLLLTIPAAIKGIFYSKNNFTKAAGFWVLLWTMNLYPTTVVAFTFDYLLLWLAVGICYNAKLRSVPEELMKIYFTNLAIVPNIN